MYWCTVTSDRVIEWQSDRLFGTNVDIPSNGIRSATNNTISVNTTSNRTIDILHYIDVVVNGVVCTYTHFRNIGSGNYGFVASYVCKSLPNTGSCVLNKIAIKFFFKEDYYIAEETMCGLLSTFDNIIQGIPVPKEKVIVFEYMDMSTLGLSFDFEYIFV